MHNVEDTLDNAYDSFQNGFSRAPYSLEVKDLNRGNHLFVQRYRMDYLMGALLT